MNNSATYRWTKQVEFKTTGSKCKVPLRKPIEIFKHKLFKVKQFQNRCQTNTTTERRNIGSNIRQYEFQTKDYYQNEKKFFKNDKYIYSPKDTILNINVSINRMSYFIKEIQNWKDKMHNVIILLVANKTSRQNNDEIGKFINLNHPMPHPRRANIPLLT